MIGILKEGPLKLNIFGCSEVWIISKLVSPKSISQIWAFFTDRLLKIILLSTTTTAKKPEIKSIQVYLANPMYEVTFDEMD